MKKLLTIIISVLFSSNQIPGPTQSNPILLRNGITTNIDLLTAGIPCQGFSMANRKKIDNDPRNLLFRSFVRAVEVFRPKCFLIENVTGINSEVINFEKKNISVTTAITEYFDSIGYTVKFLKFSSEEFGVPQIISFDGQCI